MDKQAIEQALKEDLGVVKELIALKPLKEIPSTIPSTKGLPPPVSVPRWVKCSKTVLPFIPPGKTTSAMKG